MLSYKAAQPAEGCDHQASGQETHWASPPLTEISFKCTRRCCFFLHFSLSLSFFLSFGFSLFYSFIFFMFSLFSLFLLFFSVLFFFLFFLLFLSFFRGARGGPPSFVGRQADPRSSSPLALAIAFFLWGQGATPAPRRAPILHLSELYHPRSGRLSSAPPLPTYEACLGPFSACPHALAFFLWGLEGEPSAQTARPDPAQIYHSPDGPFSHRSAT